MYARTLCWFRRDLRLDDHAALYHALKNSQSVHAVFVFDTEILQDLPPDDRRVSFIWHSVHALQQTLRARGSDLHILHGAARREIPRLAQQLRANAVFCNHDYEPAARERDAAVQQDLARLGIAWHSHKDQVIFERDEVLNGSGKPFAVFTPYKNAWLKKLNDFYLSPYPTERYAAALARLLGDLPLPSLADMGFQAQTPLLAAGCDGASALWADFQPRLPRYHQQRDFPALKGVSYLSTHLRFGTISIRALAREAAHTLGEGAQSWLSELIWRDFYQMLLWHHPRVVTESFKPAFDALRYTNNPAFFQAWQAGRTGYPLVDAAMRQLLHSGWMHNRLRMLVASFLVKDCTSTGAGASAISPRNCWILTSPPTTAAGNGPPPLAATPNPGSASSTPSPNRKNSTLMASLSAATCRNWQSVRIATCTPLGKPPPPSAAATPCPSLITPPPAMAGWQCVGSWGCRRAVVGGYNPTHSTNVQPP